MFPVVTISGSTKFKKEFRDAAAKLEKAGCIVLTTHIFSHADNLTVTDEERKMYEKMYEQSIDMSSIVYVVNKNGYIGESTGKEIEYALMTGKEVRYLNGN